MKQIKFENRAVAFLDVLGFKELVREAHATEGGRKKLSKLLERLQSNRRLNELVGGAVPLRLHPKSIEISDSIVLSTPMNDPAMQNHDGLSILAMRCSQIAAILMEQGYLVSGAINVGEVHHERANIVGIGYQDAYLLQATVCSPAIVLSQAAVDVLQASTFRLGWSPICMQGQVNFKAYDKATRLTNFFAQDAIYVNLFEPEYMKSAPGVRVGATEAESDRWLRGRVKDIEQTIIRNRRQFGDGGPTPNPSVLAKWNWMNDHFTQFGKTRIEAGYSLVPDLINQMYG